MKRFISIAALMLLCLITTGCPDKPVEDVLDIKGEWQLSQISTKASIGGQTVDVYVAFNDGGTFELYQMLGTGRYRKYAGTWSLLDKVLSGSYEGGAQWASSYNVEMDENRTQLILTTTDGSEVQTYRKASIPQDVRNDSL